MKDFNKLMSNVDEYFHTLTVDELITLMNKKILHTPDRDS